MSEILYKQMPCGYNYSHSTWLRSPSSKYTCPAHSMRGRHHILRRGAGGRVQALALSAGWVCGLPLIVGHFLQTQRAALPMNHGLFLASADAGLNSTSRIPVVHVS